MTKDIKATKKPLSDSSVFSHDAYEYFGVHPLKNNGGYIFRVFAPNAESVSVCADFNSWDPRTTPMKRVEESGVWEAVVKEELPCACKYKYFLRRGGSGSFKADPFGTCVENHRNAASVITALNCIRRDGSWLAYRKSRFQGRMQKEMPINLYRIDPLWWRRHGNGSFYRWGELASELLPYVKQMGFTHVELLGTVGGASAEKGLPDALFAPSPLLGEPRELMEFIDSAHEAGIGVILSWNPYCFAASEQGLANFDGTPLFESADGEGDHRFFDLEKPATSELLTANALFWAKQYHADGLSVADAPANRSGADGFLKRLKARMRVKTPDVMLLWGGESNVRATLMGSEFGDPWERGCQRSLSWQLLDQHMHAERQLLTARENHSFLSHAADACKKAIKTETNQD